MELIFEFIGQIIGEFIIGFLFTLIYKLIIQPILISLGVVSVLMQKCVKKDVKSLNETDYEVLYFSALGFVQMIRATYSSLRSPKRGEVVHF
ncbi:MAG: hypothetical protein RLZZ292_4064, partial [Bacteroidota bacterium]